MLSIKAILGSYLKSVRSFSEMVPWMGLNASDMVFNVDGSLMVVYEVAGIDAEGRLPIETDGYVENFERALKVSAHKFTDGAGYEPGAVGTTSYDKGHGLVDVVAAVAALG